VNKIDGWCIMCGAAPGEPCTVISGDPEAGEYPGMIRSEVHFYRGNKEKPVMTISEEENLPWADSVVPGTEVEVSSGKVLRSDGKRWLLV
jgi:hypothetical protein